MSNQVTSYFSRGRTGLLGMCLALLTASCGGGGGDPGTSTSSIVANRFNVALTTRPSPSVFYSGSNTTAYVQLTRTCSGTSCGSMPIEDVGGQVVTLTASDSSALTFTPSTAITDSEGKAQFTISAASRSVSGLVNVTAKVTLSGHDYTRTVALNVNNQVDKTISAEDDNTFQVIDVSTDCSNYPTFIVNVKDRSDKIQDNSSVSVAAVTTDSSGNFLAEAGIKDLGLFTDLGRVWLLQVRPPNPPSAQCTESGKTTQVGGVVFSVTPGDGTAAYEVGYEIKYLTP